MEKIHRLQYFLPFPKLYFTVHMFCYILDLKNISISARAYICVFFLSLIAVCLLPAKSSYSCTPLWDPMNHSPPVSSVHGILQARILKWAVMPFSRKSPQPRDQTRVSFVSCIGRQVHYLQRHLGSCSVQLYE